MGRGTLGEVRDGSGDPCGDAGRVGGKFVRSGTGRGTHSWSWMGLGTLGRHAERSCTGRGTVGGGPGRVVGASLWSGTGKGTLG